VGTKTLGVPVICRLTKAAPGPPIRLGLRRRETQRPYRARGVASPLAQPRFLSVGLGRALWVGVVRWCVWSGGR